MKKTLLLLLLGLAPLSGGCFLKSMAVDSIADSLAGTGDTFSSDNDVQLVGEAVPFSLKLMESVLSATPRHTGLLTALSKNFTQYAYAYVQSRAEEIESENYNHSKEMNTRALKLYLRGRDYGLRGLEVRYNDFRQGIRKDPKATAERAKKKEDVELLFWTGVSWMAAISMATNDPELISNVPQAEALIYRAYALDPDFDQGAIHDFLITYEGGKPAAMGGSTKKAKEHYDRSLQLNKGEHASTFVNYAEAVCVKEQDKACFKEMLLKALAVDPDHKVSSRLVNLILQKRARWLLTRTDSLFAEE